MVRRCASMVLAAMICAALSGQGLADAAMRAVTGTVDMRDRIALPPDTDVVVAVTGADGAVIASDRSRVDARQAPLPFRVWVPAGSEGTLRATIEVGERALWRSAAVPVPPGRQALAVGAVPVTRLAEAPEPEEPPVEEHAGEEPAVDGPVAEAPVADAEPPVAAAPFAADPVEPDPLEPEAPSFEAAAARAPDPEAFNGDAPAVETAVAADETWYLCGDDELAVRFQEGILSVTVGATVLELEQVPAASGARFQLRDDPETFFWSRGERAVVQFAGVELPECERAP